MDIIAEHGVRWFWNKALQLVPTPQVARFCALGHIVKTQSLNPFLKLTMVHTCCFFIYLQY